MGEYMGTTASSFKQDKMYQASSFLLLASCLSNVFCQTARPPYPPGGPPPPPAQYPTPSPVQDYNPDIGQTNVGGYGVNKDPTATRWRRSSSRTSASHTLRRPVGHKTRRLANRNCSKTAPGSLRPILSVSASM